MSIWAKRILPVAVGFFIAFLPVPEGLSVEAWHFFALFVAVILALILEPVPSAFVGLIGITLAVVLRIGPSVSAGSRASAGDAIKWGLSGFSNTTVWLIFVAFMFAMGYQKTGLGQRIALILVKYLGKTTLGLGYAIASADLLLAPFMPSNTARSGGTLFPIINSIPGMFECSPENEPRKIGAYLSWVALATTCITSSMFYTALAPNALAMSTLGAGYSFSWGEWALGFAPVGILLFAITPLLTYIVYPPTIKHSPDAPIWAEKELLSLGAITRKEILMAVLAIVALLLWIFEKSIGMHGTTSALLILSCMILLDIISWDNVLQNKGAWAVFIWFGTLIPLATGLKNVGFLTWFTGIVSEYVVHYDAGIALAVLVLAFFFIHYFFASVSAHVSALLLLFVGVGGEIVGINSNIYALLLLYTLGIMGILTPFATGPSPIWYGAGYIKAKEFWLLGIFFGIVFITTLVLVGIPWISYIMPDL